MAKKLALLAIAVAAFAAMAIPASACAALTLKDSSGKIAPGEWLVGTSTDTKITNTALGTLFCPHVEFAAEVNTNSGSLITASNGAVGPLVNCEAGGEAELTVTEPKVEHLETSGGDKGKAQLSFTADVGPFECPFGGTVDFTYETGPLKKILKIIGLILSNLEFCEEEGGEGEPVTVEATFELSTTNGTPVWIEPGA